MKPAKKVIQFIVFFFLQHLTAVAQDAATVIINDSFSAGSIGRFCYHRSGNALVTFTGNDTLWQRVNGDKVLFQPYTAYWLYFRVRNNGTKPRLLKYFINNVQSGNTRMYVFADGTVDSTGQTGSLLPPAQRANSDRFLSIPFKIEAGKTADIYLKTFRRQTGITFTPFIEDPAIKRSHQVLDYFMIFSLSLLLIIFIVSLHISIQYPSIVSGWFAAYIFFTFLYTLSASRYGSLYCWGNYPAFEENAALFFGAICATCFFELCRNLFDMRAKYRKLNAYLVSFSIFNIVLCIIGYALLFYDITVSVYSLTMAILYLLQIIGYLAVLYVSFMEAVIKKKREFLWFVFVTGFILFLITIIIFLETGKLDFSYRMHSVILSIGSVPQAIAPLLFFINRIITKLKIREQQVIEAKYEGEQKLLTERLRMSQQLHDDIGSTLSGINMYSHMALQQSGNGNQQAVSKSLRTIQESAGEMINKLNEIVWTVQPGKDNFGSLTDKIEEYATHMANAKNMQVKTVFESEVEGNAGISSEKRLHLFLIAKEAINNAAKYSNAASLFIATTLRNGIFCFSIKDDGNGFDVSAAVNGNGLENIRCRVSEIGGDLLLHSSPGKGTVVEVKVKITQ